MSTRSVLLVEDEPLIRLVLAEALIDEGYHVSMASNVLEAIGVLGRNRTFDALITDVDMPGGLDGLDLASMVASYARSTAIIVTSGRAVTEGLQPGWVFLPKPFGVEGLLQMLDERFAGEIFPANDFGFARAS